ncbi:MAG: nucleoside triphosphate pyrophosphohydrolase [Gammaproteobacteria bacterium RIFCSPLOWO2_02_FULL_61_13]|nr:MAG: nucleoside triphosphate pyrophosphohydrolase [Gammaproteobacteria bacterium RIFCSPLOWO2_02_FULL_61_13]
MRALTRLIEIMKQLRDPEAGCPWDREQTIPSILPFTLEEVYELADAIERDDSVAICDELGDLLFHLVFYARMAEESGRFNFEAVAEGVVAKLERRHPHVFGDARVDSAAAQSVAWEKLKAEERRAAGAETRFLQGIGTAMPAMLRAHKLQKRAATVGFDWTEPGPVLAKVEEELGEIKAAMAAGAPAQTIAGEVGDLLFAVINCARHLGVDPELALRSTNSKFEQRFDAIEAQLKARGQSLEQATLKEMEALWQAAKHPR